MRLPSSRCVAGLLGALALTGSLPAAAAPAPTPSRAAARLIAYQAWDAQELATGQSQGVRVTPGGLVLDEPVGRRTYEGRSYELGHWVSPWTAPGFELTELIASWAAATPGDSWIEVSVRGRTAEGRRSSWDVLGRWASTDKFVRRTTVSGQDDDHGRVLVDTWQATAGLPEWQLRVTLLRRAGSDLRPRVWSVGAVASALPTGEVPTSRPGVARGVVLDVPRYSQMVHRGHSPQWGGGGEAWCSPTSMSMVLGWYDALPPAASYAWVGDGHVDPWVDAAARGTYDHAYRGTGNWPFTTAYAAGRTGRAFVTRLRSLREAERLVAAGIPVVASISFGRGELPGAPISASNGHLLVVVGFTEAGDVVVNDPAATRRDAVRRTYDRADFEDAWLPTSGGLAYVITDDAHPLPRSPGTW